MIRLKNLIFVICFTFFSLIFLYQSERVGAPNGLSHPWARGQVGWLASGCSSSFPSFPFPSFPFPSSPLPRVGRRGGSRDPPGRYYSTISNILSIHIQPNRYQSNPHDKIYHFKGSKHGFNLI